MSGSLFSLANGKPDERKSLAVQYIANFLDLIFTLVLISRDWLPALRGKKKVRIKESPTIAQ
jgi:hypothetical protein